MDNELKKDAITNDDKGEAALSEPENELKDIQKETPEGGLLIEEAKEETEHDNEGSDSLKKKKVIKIVAIAAVALIVAVLGLQFIGNQIVAINASYDSENAKAGVVLDANNPSITVIGTKRFGGEHEMNPGEWKIEEPATLEKDKTSSVIISYKKLTTELKVECSDSAVVDFDAEYKGDTTAGTIINNNSDFSVTVKYKNGKKGTNYPKWHITESATLETDSSVEVEMVVEGIEKNIVVECSDSAVVDFEAEYKGDTFAGVEINDKSNFKVTVKYKNGKTDDAYKDWHIIAPATLVADSSAEVEIEVGGITKKISIKCSTAALVKNGRITGTLKDVMTEYQNRYGSFQVTYDGTTYEGDIDFTLKDGAYGGRLRGYTIVFQGVSSDGETLLKENEVPGSIIVISDSSYGTVLITFANLLCTLDPSISIEEACEAIWTADFGKDQSIGNLRFVNVYSSSVGGYIFKVYGKG